MKCLLCDGCGWVCENQPTPISLGKASTPAPAAEPACLAAIAIYITKLPKAEHEAAEWQAAMEALILVATLGGPTMFARIGVMRALNRHVERVF